MSGTLYAMLGGVVAVLAVAGFVWWALRQERRAGAQIAQAQQQAGTIAAVGRANEAAARAAQNPEPTDADPFNRDRRRS